MTEILGLFTKFQEKLHFRDKKFIDFDTTPQIDKFFFLNKSGQVGAGGREEGVNQMPMIFQVVKTRAGCFCLRALLDKLMTFHGSKQVLHNMSSMHSCLNTSFLSKSDV